jgi:hypothetical protein
VKRKKFSKKEDGNENVGECSFLFAKIALASD